MNRADPGCFLMLSGAIIVFLVMIAGTPSKPSTDGRGESCATLGTTLGIETRYMPDWGCWRRTAGEWERVP